MPWWIWMIFPVLLAWFVIGFLLGLLIWWWRRRSESAEMERRRLESDAESDRLRLRIDSLKDSEERATQLAGQVSQLEGRVGTLQSDAERARELELELGELRPKIDSLDAMETQVVALRAEADSAAALDAQLRSARIEFEDARDRARRLELDLSVAQSTAAEVDSLRAELSSAQASAQSGTADVDSLRAELAVAEADAAEVDTVRSEVETLRAELAAVQATAEGRLADLNTCQDHVAELERELEGAMESASAAVVPVVSGLPVTADAPDEAIVEDEVTDDEAVEVDDEDVDAEAPAWQVGTTAVGTPGIDHRDDLKAINGIGPVLERTLNGLGIQSWEQIAALTPDDVTRVQEAIQTFPGRVERDDWIGGAKELLVGHVPGEDTSRKRSSYRRRSS